MTARPSGEQQPAGASRRDVLRGGAVGLGAFVGATALLNAGEATSEAKSLTPSLKFTVGFAGINLDKFLPLHSFTLGGELNGSPNPTSTTLTLDTNQHSPQLLQAYAEGTNLAKIIIKGYRANQAGLVALFMTATMTSARIVTFHTDVVTTEPAHVHDIVQVIWNSLTLQRNDTNKSYDWVLPT